MDPNTLMTGIGVVIDDAIGGDGDSGDLIVRIVESLERDWFLPCYKTDRLPPEDHWASLFRSASFVLLDWKLWRGNASQLVQRGVAANVRFLEHAVRHFVPVLIFTNESVVDVADALPSDIYRTDQSEGGVVLIRNKAQLLSGNVLDLSPVHNWMKRSASVYALKTWESVLYDARKALFGDMYAISPHWPKVFWRAYREDGVDPSLGLTQLIADGLWGRIRTNRFTDANLSDRETGDLDVPIDDLRALIGATTFRIAEPEDDIRCGDLFQLPRKKFLLNVRPDCDCIPRDGLGRDEVDLYCLEGKRIREAKLPDEFRRGHFDERADQSIVFAVIDGRSIRFRFKNLRIATFGAVKNQRIGRLLHPYLTRVQQRYALYLQRQGLPRIPAGAVSTKLVDGEET